MPDDRIVAKAQEEERTIVTHDLDFGRIVALSGFSVPSIVTLRLSNMTPARVNTALQAVLDDGAQSLERGALSAASPNDWTILNTAPPCTRGRHEQRHVDLPFRESV